MLCLSNIVVACIHLELTHNTKQYCVYLCSKYNVFRVLITYCMCCNPVIKLIQSGPKRENMSMIGILCKHGMSFQINSGT